LRLYVIELQPAGNHLADARDPSGKLKSANLIRELRPSIGARMTVERSRTRATHILQLRVRFEW
jgi:hypothetical protein